MSRLREISGHWGILPLFFMAMESAWLTALFDLIARAGEKPAGVPLELCCLLYPAAYLCGRFIRPRELPRLKEWALGAALGLLATVLILKPVLFAQQSWHILGWSLETITRPPWTSWFLAAGCGGFVWLRGWFLSGKRVNLKGMAGAFQAGLVVFLVVLPFLGVMGLSAGRSWLLVSGFFVFGLSGLWLAGRIENRETGADRGGATWFVLVALALGAVLVLGYAVWSIVDRDLLEILLRPFVWLWERFVELMSYLSTLLPKPKPMVIPGRGTAANVAPQPFRNPLLDLTWLKNVAEFVFLAATSTIVGMALFRTLTDLVAWLRRRFARNAAPAVESSDYGFLDDLKVLFLALFSWLKRLLGFLTKKPKEGPRVSPEAKTVREIYRRFLIWGRAKGSPKDGGATPYEYQAQMSRILPERQDELGLLTEAYVLVRYGGINPGPELIRMVRVSWRKIKSSAPLELIEESQP